MLSEEEAMEILETYDLTRSFRSTAALCGVDYHTVRPTSPPERPAPTRWRPSGGRPSPIRSSPRSPSGSNGSTLRASGSRGLV